MEPQCKACASSRERPRSGAYNFRCLDCCARLVLSAYPDKRRAGAMLEAIQRCPGNPGRERVLACVSQTLAKRP